MSGVVVPIVCQTEDCGRNLRLPLDKHGWYAFYFKPEEYSKFQMRIGRSGEDIQKEIRSVDCPICKRKTMVFVMRKRSAQKFKDLAQEIPMVVPGQMNLPGEEAGISEPDRKMPSQPDFIDIEKVYRVDKVYSLLIDEINTCFEYEAYSSARVMLRKLVENLVIDILRFKYEPMKQHEMYFNDGSKHFLPLKFLIQNFEQISGDYVKYGFTKNHLASIKGLRRKGNESAHSVVDFVTKKKMESIKKNANTAVIMLLRIIGIIKGVMDEKGRLVKKKKR